MKKILIICSILTVFISCSGKSESNPTSPGNGSENGERQDSVRIMTYNIHGGIPQGGTTPDLNTLASVIKAASPDVVMLQEADSATITSGKTDQTKELARLADFPYYYFANAFSTDGGGFGIGLLSKYPIENPSKTLLPKLPASGYVEQRALCKAQIRFTGNMVYTVATSHFDLTDVNRQAGVTTIVNELGKSVFPVIFGGDLNVSPSNSVITRLDSAGFKRTCTSNCFSFPANNPTGEIDYIMYNPAGRFSVLSHKVITGTTASDHLPVVAVLKLK